MTEVSIRRMPIDDSAGSHQVIVQVPIHNTECYQLPDLLGINPTAIHWITPVQVSAQYSGIPAPGFTFTIRPYREQEGGGQWVDVFYRLNKVALISIGGPHGRIVTGNSLDEQLAKLFPEMAEAVAQVTVAFLVQYEVPHEDTFAT
jgi:hypothetical protein